MSLTQVCFRGRGDSEHLNAWVFDHDLNQNWAQSTDRTFRVRFEVEDTAGTARTMGGTLEASLTSGSWFAVTPTSGTVTAESSVEFTNGDPTRDLLSGTTTPFTAGEGSEDGVAAAVVLNNSHTEHEYAVKILSEGVANGDTIALRIRGCDSYPRSPLLIVSEFSERDKVRLMIGDTDSTDPLLTDAEVDRYVAAWPDNPDLAAANAAEAIGAKFAREFDFGADQQTFNRSQKVNQYMTLAAQLRSRGASMASR